MKLLTQLLLTAIPVAATSSILTLELAQEPQEPATPFLEMTPQEQMMAMMQLGAPGEQHKRLAKNAGKWDMVMSYRMAPDAPWESTKGSVKTTMTLGGRYMIEQSSFSMMGVEHKGMLLLGFDNLTQKYQSVWVDTWGTRMMVSEGTEVKPGVVEYHGLMKDLVTPEGRPYMFRVTEKSDDEALFEMYDTIPEGPEAPMPSEPNVMVMKMEYTRAKA